MRAFLSLSTLLSPQSGLLNRVTQGVTLSFVGVSAWWLGQLIWQMTIPASTAPQWQPPTIKTATAPTSLINLAALTQLNLFGEYLTPSKAKPVSIKPIVMPKTRLKVTLVGVVASRDPKYSLAVLGQGKTQETYGIGETLTGTQVTVKNIFSDRVILNNRGQAEVVWLDGETPRLNDEPSFNSTPRRSPSTVTRPRSATDLNAIKKQVIDNPKVLFRYIRLSPVRKNKKLIGYRVNPGKDPALFQDIGLKPNDLAVQLNGQDLTDPSVMATLWQELSSASALALTVDRNGQLHQVEINL